MTNEVTHNTAREIVHLLQWMDEDEEKKVLDLVKQILWDKRHRDISQRG